MGKDTGNASPVSRQCPHCGADEWSVYERSAADLLVEWLRTGWRAPRRSIRCGRCGEPAGTALRPLLAGRRPRRARRLRLVWPIRLAPWVYLAAAGVGVAVGVALDATVGWPWWAVGLAVVALTWLAFMLPSVARWRWGGPAGLGIGLLEAVLPRAARLREGRLVRRMFERPPFPLYGLPPSWSGPRSIGGWGATMGRVNRISLVHGAARRGGTLTVETWDAPSDGALRLIRAGAAEDLEWEYRQAPDAASGSLDWEPVTIRVDGSHVPFELARRGDAWAAVAGVRTGVIVVQARGFAVEEIELARVTDPTPYIKGQPPTGSGVSAHA